MDDDPTFLCNIMMGDEKWLSASWITWNHQHHQGRWNVARTVLMERWIWRYFFNSHDAIHKEIISKRANPNNER